MLSRVFTQFFFIFTPMLYRIWSGGKVEVGRAWIKYLGSLILFEGYIAKFFVSLYHSLLKNNLLLSYLHKQSLSWKLILTFRFE